LLKIVKDISNLKILLNMKEKLFVVEKSNIDKKGMFATKDINKGTHVVEYVGEKITKAEGDKRSEELLELAEKDSGMSSVFVFELDDKYDIDGNVDHNLAKFINHSCEPNCEVNIIDNHIWIIAIKDIKKGEEITYDYSYDLEDFQDHHCKCGSKKCFGFILDGDLWDQGREILKKKNK
jgi:uncharacterized protein